MSEGSIIVARPPAPSQLVLLFHGVGSSAANLVPLAEAIAQARPTSAVVSIEGPHPSTLGTGREWFSVVGITEQNRPGRIAAALPLVLQAVATWQDEFGISPENTVLVGFSQGAILALESTQLEGSAIAMRIVAMAGRFAQPVRLAPRARVHLIHGDQDNVVPTRCSIDATRALQALGADVSLDVIPGLGHGIDARAVRLLLRHLEESPPQR